MPSPKTFKEAAIQLLRRSEQMDTLKKVPLFTNLSKRDLNQITRHMDQVRFKAGKVLVKEGELGREFLILLKGEVRVKRKGRTIRKMSKGSYFGEISMISPGLRTATVEAETDVELLVLNTRSFNHLLDSVKGLARKMLVAVCDYVREQEDALKKQI